jgi:23S rRNA (uracil1939-C5)-methyltransferase
LAQVGDRLTLRIQSLAFGGDGIARHDGIVIFVPFTAPEDSVEVVLTEKSPRFARGKVLSILEPSVQRSQPPCPYYGRCGGCQYQHLSYEAELASKELQVRDAFVRIGKLPDPPIRKIIASPSPYAYRNRITVHAESGHIGFRGVNPREIISIEKCALAMPEVNDALAKLRASQPRDGHYSLRHPSIPPSAFYQVNHLFLDTLRSLVAETFGTGLDRGVDAYCGGGFFTSAMASKFKQVIGIEKDARALIDARRLGISNLELVEGEVENELDAVLRQGDMSRTALLLDPPREGLPSSITRCLIELRPAELTYVSCHPPTLARDAQKLLPHYELISVQPIDLFPRTSQIECVTTWRQRST